MTPSILTRLGGFGGGCWLTVREVEPGTAIECDGETLDVLEGGPVFRHHEIFITPKDYAALKAKALQDGRDA